MKKILLFAVAVLAAGAGWHHSHGNAALALSAIEKQSLHDAPNDDPQAQEGIWARLKEKFGLDHANSAPSPDAKDAGGLVLPAPPEHSLKNCKTALTPAEIKHISELAKSIYENPGPDGLTMSQTGNDGNTYTITVHGDHNPDRTMTVHTITLQIDPSGDVFAIRMPEGTISARSNGRPTPITSDYEQDLLKNTLYFWLSKY